MKFLPHWKNPCNTVFPCNKSWVSLVWQGTVSRQSLIRQHEPGATLLLESDLLHADQSGHIPTTSILRPWFSRSSKALYTLALLLAVAAHWSQTSVARSAHWPTFLAAPVPHYVFKAAAWRSGHSWMNLAAFFQGPSWIFFFRSRIFPQSNQSHQSWYRMAVAGRSVAICAAAVAGNSISIVVFFHWYLLKMYTIYLNNPLTVKKSTLYQLLHFDVKMEMALFT